MKLKIIKLAHAVMWLYGYAVLGFLLLVSGYIILDIFTAVGWEMPYRYVVISGVTAFVAMCLLDWYIKSKVPVEQSQEALPEDKTFTGEGVTRFEVIDYRQSANERKRGRIYSVSNVKIELSVQDNGHTLKIFVGDKDKS